MGFLSTLGDIAGFAGKFASPIGAGLQIGKTVLDLFNNRQQNKKYNELEDAGTAQIEEATKAYKDGKLTASTVEARNGLDGAIMNSQGAGLSGRIADEAVNRAERNAIDVAKQGGGDSGAVGAGLVNAVLMGSQEERSAVRREQVAEDEKNKMAVRLARQDYNTQANQRVKDEQLWNNNLLEQGYENQIAGREGSHNMDNQFGGILGQAGELLINSSSGLMEFAGNYGSGAGIGSMSNGSVKTSIGNIGIG